MASAEVDIARLENLANTLAQGLESLLAEVKQRQDEESKQLSKYKCIAAQACTSGQQKFS
jgi:predicted ATP-grasp superfamily ATP-dependent carboligase